MNFKTTLILLGLAIGVAAYFIFVEQNTTSKREQAQLASQDGEGTALLTEDTIDPTKVTRIEIQRGGDDSQAVILEKRDGNWRQTAPVMFPLDSRKVGRIPTGVTQLRYIDRFTPGGDAPSRSDADLDPPQATITLTQPATEGGEDTGETEEKSVTLHLGNKSVAGNGYLMREDDEQIYIVGDALHSRVLDNTVKNWRKKTFQTPDTNKTDQVVLNKATGRLALRKHEGQWYLDDAHTQRASDDAIGSLIDAVGNARIDEFVEDKPGNMSVYGLDAPQLTLTMRQATVEDGEGSGNGAAHVLRVGAATDLSEQAYYATWSTRSEPSAVVFSLSKDDIDKLRKDADALRDPSLITTPAEEIKTLRVERPDRPTLHLQRDSDSGFVFADPAPGYDVDYDAASTLLESLADAEATGYDAGFQPEGDLALTVHVTQRGAGLTETLQLYPAEVAGEYLSIRKGEPVAYLVNRSAINGLFEPRLAYRDKNLFNLKERQIARLTVTRPDGVRFSFKRQSGAATQPANITWSLDGHDAFESDALDSMFEAFAPLRISEWSAERAKPASGWGELDVRTTDGTQYTLHVDPESRRAVIDGVGPSFKVPQSLVDKLTAEYRDRTALSLTQDDIASITIEAGGESLTVRKGADDQYVAANADEIDQSKAGKLYDTLSGLQVERYTKQRKIAPTRTLTIRTADETTYTLGLHGEGDYASLSPTDEPYQAAFILGDNALETLRFDLTNQEDEGGGSGGNRRRPQMPQGMPQMPGMGR